MQDSFYDRCQYILHAFVSSKGGLSFRRQLIICESGYISVFTAALKRAEYFVTFLYAFLDNEATLTGNRILLSNESICSYGNKFFPISGDPLKKKANINTVLFPESVYSPCDYYFGSFSWLIMRSCYVIKQKNVPSNTFEILNLYNCIKL